MSNDKVRDRCVCIDCDINTKDIDEYYMVKNEIWEEFVPEKRGMLCIGCLEIRMGRELVPSDFLECILNDTGWQDSRSDRLLARLGHMKHNVSETDLEGFSLLPQKR